MSCGFVSSKNRGRTDNTHGPTSGEISTELVGEAEKKWAGPMASTKTPACRDGKICGFI